MGPCPSECLIINFYILQGLLIEKITLSADDNQKGQTGQRLSTNEAKNAQTSQDNIRFIGNGKNKIVEITETMIQTLSMANLFCCQDPIKRKNLIFDRSHIRAGEGKGG